MIKGYDQWKTDTPYDESIAGTCGYCGENILAYEEIYFTAEGEVHDECFHDLALEVLDASKGTGEDLEEQALDDYYDNKIDEMMLNG